jgi:hypothetical protein
MQHRYFGDVGDFGKYGLLRILCGLNETPHLRLSVVWYLYPDESHNKDGKHLGYLGDGSYRACDEVLYDSLKSALLDDAKNLRPDCRHLDTLDPMRVLPDDTVYWTQPLSYPAHLSPALRQEMRKNWFDAALLQTRSAEIVFLDPDNGIECASVGRLSQKGLKYAYWDDLDPFVERGQSLVLYHHLNRSATHAAQVAQLLDKMRCRFPACEPMATIFRRGSGRAYFIIPSADHRSLLHERFERFAAGKWKKHFVTKLSGLVDSF